MQSAILVTEIAQMNTHDVTTLNTSIQKDNITINQYTHAIQITQVMPNNFQAH